ncbi:MAG: ABC transporter permease [Gammaproteobacteria bacterium]|nr:ABC transporter permease [Gammaproteobacteria bacterium]MBI5617609.1 ABC transporter permease [Gammaproteobacteria bacterium]
MRPRDALAFALRAVSSQRQRSGLTILGIAVGIATVVLLTSMGRGVRVFVKGEFTQFGTNIIGIHPGKTETLGMTGGTISSVRQLTVEDAEALARLPAIDGVMPSIQGNAEVKAGGKHRRAFVFGVGPDIPRVWNMQVALGRFLPPDTLRSPRAYAVLGARMHRELFGTASPLGARIKVGDEILRVVGVMKPKGQMLGYDLDDTLFMPVAMAKQLFDREGLMEIDVVYEPGYADAWVADAVKRVLLARHGREDFTIITQDKMLAVLDSILTILTAGVAALGGISLVVGAVGITTIMTIAIAERTAEIGLLRALGTRRADLVRLFLLEATALGAVGGLLGLGAALACVALLEALVPDFPLEVAWGYAGAALVLAVGIGLAAGAAPAARVARLDPVEALRAE